MPATCAPRCIQGDAYHLHFQLLIRMLRLFMKQFNHVNFSFSHLRFSSPLEARNTQFHSVLVFYYVDTDELFISAIFNTDICHFLQKVIDLASVFKSFLPRINCRKVRHQLCLYREVIRRDLETTEMKIPACAQEKKE